MRLGGRLKLKSNYPTPEARDYDVVQKLLKRASKRKHPYLAIMDRDVALDIIEHYGWDIEEFKR